MAALLLKAWIRVWKWIDRRDIAVNKGEESLKQKMKNIENRENLFN